MTQQYILNTGAKEIQHFNPSEHDNRPSTRPHPSHLYISAYFGTITESEVQPAGMQLKRKAKLPTVIGLNLSLQNINESSTCGIMASFTVSVHKQIQVVHSAFTSNYEHFHL